MDKNIRIVFLFVLVILSLSGYANKFIVESFKPDPGDLAAQRFERKDNSGKPCALIKVITDIEKLSFDSDHGIVGSVVNKSGEYWVYVSAGEKSLRISKEGFDISEVNCIEFNIKIESSSVYVIKLRSEMAANSLLETPQQTGNFLINTIPQWANISVEGEPEIKGVTPYLIEEHPAGVYIIRLQKEYYKTKDTAIQIVSGGLTNMTVTLVPNVGLLFFKVNPPPPTANIYIDGKLIQGIKANKAVPILKGSHDIVINSKNWISEERKVNIVLGKTDSLTVELKPEMGSLRIDVSPSKVEKAEIWINDKKTEHFAPAVFPHQVGDFTVSLKKEGFPVKSQNITLSKAENLTLKFTMSSFEELKKQIKRNRVKQDIWMASTLIFGATSGYFIMDAKNKYRQYQEATGQNANSLHTTIESDHKIGAAALGVTLFSAIEFSFQLFKKGQNKHLLKFGTNGKQAGLTANF